MEPSRAGPEFLAATRALAALPGAAVVERDDAVVWASPQAGVEVGAPWVVSADDAGGAPVVLDGAVHRVWRRAAPSDDRVFRALFEVNAAIKLLIDQGDGRIVDANPAAVAFYGWDLAELRARSIFDLNMLTPAEVQAEMERARTLRRTYFQFRHRTRGGAIADVEVYSGPVQIGGRTLLLSIIHDVTETRRIEEHMRRAQRLEALGRLAGGVAHDVGNLLTIIAASAQLAQRRGDAETAPFLAEILAATRRGADLTRRLLALGSQQALVPTVVPVRELVDRTVELVRPTLPERIAVATEVAEPLPPVLVDRGQIEMALLNLAINARDAMPAGGTLSLVAGAARDVPEVVARGDYVAVAVRDTGTGMDAATRARVFEPFFTTKPPGVGTGLGLPVAFGVVSQCGGTITVDSQPGRGSTFTVYLPVAPT